MRDLGLDVPVWRQRFGARIAGRSRTPALVVPLRRAADPVDAGWAPLYEIADLVGTDRVEGLTGLRIDRWRNR